LAATVDPARIHLDHRLISFQERPSHIELRFANGTTHDAEFLIAADGIHSVVRRALYGDDAPAYTGQMVWRALLSGASVPADVLAPGHVQWLGSGRHFFAYYLRGREVVNIVTQQDTDHWVAEGWSISGDVEEMRASFPDPEPRLAALLNAVTRCSQWGLFLRPVTKDWGRGRIQLIGDAAHAMLPNAGQGAGQAFEDAYILARWLAAMPADPVEAMANFRRVRIPRVHAVQRHSSAIVRAKHDYDPKTSDSTRAKVDAADAMAWIWGYDVTAGWKEPPESQGNLANAI
jgi:salicylate hydroxylase